MHPKQSRLVLERTSRTLQTSHRINGQDLHPRYRRCTGDNVWIV